MSEKKIKTYNTASFREKYIQQEEKVKEMMKTHFDKFFVVKVEEMLQLMKLPVPPTRNVMHSFIYLTEGEAIMTIGSEEYIIHAHECMVVPAGQVFSFSNFDVNKGYLCSFHNDFIIGKFGKSELLKDFEFLQIWGHPVITFTPHISYFIETLFKRILLEFTTNGLKNLDIIQPYFIALLCEANHAYQPLSNSPQTNAVNITNRFKELIFTHYKTHHLVSDYANMLNISPNHLNKCVKLITKKSPTKWIDEAIILESKVLLHQSTYSISEIAAAVGHLDASYFSRLFKKHEGITPLEFRKRIEKS